MSKERQRRADRRFRRQKSKNWCRVYVLREIVGGPIRYVGQTRQSPEMRLWWHLKDVRRCKERGWGLTAVKKWIDQLPTSPVIEVIVENGIWDISEAVWIDRLSHRGEPLLNKASVVPDNPTPPAPKSTAPDERWKALFSNRGGRRA